MEKISEEVLHRLLERGNTIKDREIDFKEINLEYIQLAEFENCNFTSPRTHFTKNPTYESETISQKINISFKSCSFNDLLILKINNFDNVSFSHIKMAKSILIHHSNCNSFNFEDSDNINYHIEILGCDFQKRFTFTTNTFVKKGKFQLFENTFQENTFITKNTFYDLNIEKQKFLSYLFFQNNYNKDSNSEILLSEFKTTIISISNFSNFIFNNCLFFEEFYLENCKNLEYSEVKFENCHFEKYSKFDNSKFNKIEILHSKFSEKVSFENLEVNYFKIHQVSFLEATYFDDLNRNNNKAIENWDIKTLRAIKRELQRTENRIDFNRFRAYELAAHYEELNYKENFKDVAILWATKWSSNYGSWTWAFWFTLIIGFVFFTPFYILENIKLTLDLNNWKDFLYGYFRFFLITDFKNEYYEGGESILKFNCFLSLVPFIFGKIAVAFGIYEMIQSFRKFKA